MGEGLLQINVKTASDALPVPDAHVKIFNTNNELLYETDTDANGITQMFSISAPDKSLTLEENYKKPAYSTVNAIVSASGFVNEHINGIEIVDTQTSILPIQMEPLSSGPNPITDKYTDIPPIGLLSDEPYQKEGAIIPQTIARVLPQVVIPDHITVHLGIPSNTSARNVRVRFVDYVKNVTSSEIYSTWPRNSLIANIHAITTFALNRVYTEWYRIRGYNFDITNSTAYDQAFREGAVIFQNVSQIVDGIFNVYAHRHGFRNPYFTSFCNGSTVTCPGLSQWGTVTLANQGRTPIEILRHFYPKDLELTASNNITGITESYPGQTLSIGSNNQHVRRMQNFLNRIRINFPLIPRIENPNGLFGPDTAEAVRVFQRTFNLVPDGIIGRNTWNRISFIYVAVARLAELNGEGERISIGKNPPNVVLSQGSRGNDVIELQFILNTLAMYYPEIPTVIQDSLFDARDRNAVIAFQSKFGLAKDGVVGPATWNKLYEVYRGVRNNVPIIPNPPPLPQPNTPPFPGTLLRVGSRGENVRIIQEYLNIIRKMYPSIPQLNVDGVFGPNTQNAVMAFQRQFFLTPDGIVGPITWNKIMEQYVIATGDISSTPVPPPNYFNYTVLAGDSLWNIAFKFGTTVDAIRKLNNITGDIINIGQVLKVPNTYENVEYFEYRVQSGDTLWALAQRFGTTVNAIVAINGLTSTLLNIGQTLKIPSESTITQPGYFNYTVQSGDNLWLLAQRFGTTIDAIMSSSGITSTALRIGQVLRIPTNTAIARTVVIDPGHGGPNPGAVSGTRLEKNDNLRLGLAVQRNLLARGQRVIMTRNADVDVPLLERSDISNRNNADLFVSLHRNASTIPTANGVETFVQIGSPPINTTYARNVQNEIVAVGVQTDRGVKQENFSVLRNTRAPAMLVELGFITNQIDNQLFDQNFDAYAAAITRGIMRSLQ